MYSRILFCAALNFSVFNPVKVERISLVFFELKADYFLDEIREGDKQNEPY